MGFLLVMLAPLAILVMLAPAILCLLVGVVIFSLSSAPTRKAMLPLLWLPLTLSVLAAACGAEYATRLPTPSSEILYTAQNMFRWGFAGAVAGLVLGLVVGGCWWAVATIRSCRSATPQPPPLPVASPSDGETVAHLRASRLALVNRERRWG